jgi:hypothetical protein
MTITAYIPYAALALLLSACATMSIDRQFDSSDVARNWQMKWDRTAWDAPKDASVTGVTDLFCKRASEQHHALWCSFNLHYSSAGALSTLPMERWLVDRDTLAYMKSLRPRQ